MINNIKFKLANPWMPIIFVFCLSFAINPVLPSGGVTNAQSDSEVILKKVQNKFNSIEDLSADFKQSISEKLNLKGKIYFKQQDKLRFEMDNVLIISDGETSWNYNKKENKVIILENVEEVNHFSIRKIIYDYPEKCVLSSGVIDGTSVLTLIPEDSELNFNSAKLFINSDDLIFKAVIDDPAAGMIQLDFSNFKINQDLADSDFSFTPPEGSNIIDLR